jgi:NAD(P)H dehydrogenase (quinone)
MIGRSWPMRRRRAEAGEVLVVTAHPCPESYHRAVVDAAVRGLTRGGHTITVLDLYELGFRAAMTREERVAYHGAQPLLDPMAAEHAALVQRAPMLVFIYPTWWSGPPAVMKGWLERVLVPGVGFTFDERTGKVEPGLRHVRHLVGVSTYGAPWTYIKATTDCGRRLITRTLRLSCGWRARPRWFGLYAMDTAGPAERAAFLDRVEHGLAAL